MRADDHEAVLLAGKLRPEVPGKVYRDIHRQPVEARAQESRARAPLVGPAHAAGAVRAAGQARELAQVLEHAVRVHRGRVTATAAGAPSERGTKWPWPGWVTISPRS